MEIPQNQLFELIGDECLRSITDTFYDKVADEPIFAHMFPVNKKFSKLFLYLFLKESFGGPGEYREMRGHPMMRKRHLMFNIGWDERNTWLKLFFESMDIHGVDENHVARKSLEKYFESMATKILNVTPKTGLRLS